MSSMKHILVTGAGGFIGHHLVNRLKSEGCWVRGADVKYPEYQSTAADEFKILDLRRWENCQEAVRDVAFVYNLAEHMGGIGYIPACPAGIATDNGLRSTPRH